MHKLYKAFGVFRTEQDLNPVLNSKVLQDYPTLAELQEHWGVAGHLVPTSRAIPLELFIAREEEECTWKDIVVPAGEVFSLGTYIGGGVVTKGIWYAVEGGSAAISGTIELYDVANDAVVHSITVADFSQPVNDYSVFAKYIKLEEPHIFRISFDALPATNADGDQVWWNECDVAPCLRVKAHLLIDDTCYKPTFYGCVGSACNGFEEPPFVCPDPAPVVVVGV